MITSLRKAWTKMCKSFDLEEKPLILKKRFINNKKIKKK